MNRLTVSRPVILATTALFCALFAVGIRAQSNSTEIRSGEVVYAVGNDLVVRMADGQIKHFNLPESARFTIDGKQVPTSALTPGTKLTQTITSTETPETVETVRTVTGVVWFASAPKTVILTLPDKTQKTYYVPSGTTFTVDGKKVEVGDLRKGDRLTATVVTTSTVVRSSTTNVVRGTAPPPVVTPPPTPALAGSPLLIEQPQAPAEAPKQQASAQLPKTAGNTALYGMLGVLALGMALGVRAFRKRLA